MKLGVNIVINEFVPKNFTAGTKIKEIYKEVKNYSELNIKRKPKDVMDLIFLLKDKYFIEGFDTTSIYKEGIIYISLRKLTNYELKSKKSSKVI